MLNKKIYKKSVILINDENIELDINEQKCICGVVSKREDMNKTVNSINILINSKLL